MGRIEEKCKLTPTEANVAKALARETKIGLALEARTAKARRELIAEGCSHPAEACRSFAWEHDNGYGRQSAMKGLQCTLCMARCHYPPTDGKHPGKYQWGNTPDWLIKMIEERKGD